MSERGLILFGKHPAWSDHMFVGAEIDGAAALKSVFYDKSVITALQAGDESERSLEDLCFLVWCRERAFWVVSVPSSDSVGRRRFPLFAARPISPEILEVESVSALSLLSLAIREFIEAVQRSSTEGAAWQAEVKAGAADFSFEWPESAPEMSDEESLSGHSELKRDDLCGLLTQLLDDRRVFVLEGRSMNEVCALAQVGCRQFSPAADALLIFDREVAVEALVFSNTGAFALQSWLGGQSSPITVDQGRVASAVTKLLEKEDIGASTLADSAPSLRIGASRAKEVSKAIGLSHKQLAVVVGGILLLSIFIGLLVGGGEGNEESSTSDLAASGADSGSAAAREAWTDNAAAYIDWVLPLKEYLEENEDLVRASRVRAQFESELNPFTVVSGGSIRHDLVGNPLKRTFIPENQASLQPIYARIQSLEASMFEYFESESGVAEFLWLRDQGYLVPDFLSSEATDVSWFEPVFNENLVSRLQLVVDVGPVLKRIRKIVGAAESNLGGISALPAAASDTILKQLRTAFFNASTVDALSLAADRFEEWKLTLSKANADGLAVEAMLVSEGWQGLAEDDPSPENADYIMDLLADYCLVPRIRFDQLIEQSEQVADRIRAASFELRQNFPDVRIDGGSIESELVSDLSELKEFGESPITNLAFIKAEQTQTEFAKKWTDQAKNLEEIFTRNADPETWMDRFASEISELAGVGLREVAEKELWVLKDRITSRQEATAKGYSAFKEGAKVILESLREVDLSFDLGDSEEVLAYLASGGKSQAVESFVLERLTSSLSRSGDPMGVVSAAKTVRYELILDLDNLRQAESVAEQAFSDLTSGEDAVEILRSKIQTVLQNPLHTNQLWVERLGLLESGAEGESGRPATGQGLFWYLKSAQTASSVNEPVLASAASAAEAMASLPPEAGTIYRETLRSFARAILVSDPSRLLVFFASMDRYFPIALQSPGDLAIREVANYFLENEKSEPASIPELSVILDRIEAARHPIEQEFFTAIQDVSADPGAGQEVLREMIAASPLLRSFTSSDAPLSIDIEIVGGNRLRFLPVATPNGGIFVQQRPLSLPQFLTLLKALGEDVSDRLFRMEKFWPRSFVLVADGSDFRALPAWEFLSQDREVFEAIDAFSRSATPAYITEPNDAKVIAEAMGFRLFLPEEVGPFLATAESLPRGLVELTAAQIESLEESKTFSDSVYRSKIAERAPTGGWKGGLDFEREIISPFSFFDVLGGSAELVWDGQEFSAFGGSWLYFQDPSMLVPINDSSRMYSDLGIRFVFPAPAPTFSEISFEAAKSAMRQWLLRDLW